MAVQALFEKFKRLQKPHVIASLPVAILMPHSACNCRCIMCDIWKANKNLKQLEEQDICSLLETFHKLKTRMVLMSGGEALLNPNFFRFCELLKAHGIRISLLSTGLTLQKHAGAILEWVHDLVVSLDGDELVHDRIRNISGAFRKLKDGVHHIKKMAPHFPVSARTVIHRHNYRYWPRIIEAAVEIGVDRISFLPADISSQAFNREIPWNKERKLEILPEKSELPALELIIDEVIRKFYRRFDIGFFAESPQKLRRIHEYYEACHGLKPYPYKKCNAPWVSTVIEADGTVRPCFFHQPIGNIHQNNLEEILNGDAGVGFRKTLDMSINSTCQKCVCSLHYRK